MYDRLSDLARVLRIPARRTTRTRRNPKDVTVSQPDGSLYNLSDFEEFLDDARIPDPEAEESAAREWAERFADKPLVIDPNARIPQEMLDAWMDRRRRRMRFRNTWNRQRHDLKDQSQSGYDLALACFGIDAGLSEQQIVDLISTTGALHSQKQRTRLDYFQRTIAKAEKRTGGSAARARQSGRAHLAAHDRPGCATRARPAAPESQQATDTTTEPRRARRSPGPGGARRRSCASGSRRRLAIRSLRLVKITGKEPQYRMELADGQKIEFANVGKLIAQESRARRPSPPRSAGSSRRSKPRSGRSWRRPCSTPASSSTGTEEMEWEGAARMYLQHYLAETGFIPAIEGQRLQDQRKPHGHGRQDHRLRVRPPGVRQQDDVPEPLRQGRRRDAVGARRAEHPGARPEVQGPVPVGAAAQRVRSRRVPAERGRHRRMTPSTEQRATGTLEEIGQRDHEVTSEYRIFGPPAPARPPT